MRYKVVPNVLGYLEKSAKILLGLRKDHPSKIYRDHWDLPGGQIEPGETVEEALKREFLEETGLTIVRARLTDAYHNSDPDEGAPGLCLLYRIEKVEGEIKAASDLQAVEYVETFRIKELRLPPWSKYFLRKYLPGEIDESNGA
jgi:8-oxo-dGTP diphosphatase